METLFNIFSISSGSGISVPGLMDFAVPAAVANKRDFRKSPEREISIAKAPRKISPQPTVFPFLMATDFV
ncbi:MAG: hypothetical protein NC825_03795 [Candidatus Omnitrophica bacterium]|nr:hypothetical protein [Candidatus Omnitrophota bacterium]